MTTRPISSLESVAGHRFGVLTVIRDHVAGGQRRRVLCRCDCGAEMFVRVLNLRQDPDRTRCSAGGCAERRRKRGAA